MMIFGEMYEYNDCKYVHVTLDLNYFILPHTTAMTALESVDKQEKNRKYRIDFRLSAPYKTRSVYSYMVSPPPNAGPIEKHVNCPKATGDFNYFPLYISVTYQVKA